MWIRLVSKNMTGVTVPPATVGTTAAPITAAPVTENHGAVFAVRLQANPSNTADIFIGDANVSLANGFRVSPGSGDEWEVFDPYSLWAISTSPGQDLRIFYV